MEKTYPDAQMESLKPPVTSIGVIGWMRFNLFNGAFNSILTIITLFLLWKTVPPVFKWAFVDSIWLADSSACRGGRGLLVCHYRQFQVYYFRILSLRVTMAPAIGHDHAVRPLILQQGPESLEEISGVCVDDRPDRHGDTHARGSFRTRTGGEHPVVGTAGDVPRTIRGS